MRAHYSAFDWFLSLPRSQRERHIKVAKLLVRERISISPADAMDLIWQHSLEGALRRVA